MGKVIYFSGPDGAGKTTSFLRAVEISEMAGKTAFQLRTLQVRRLQMLARAQAKRNQCCGETEADKMGSVGRLGYSDLPRHRGKGVRFTLRRNVGLLAAIADIASYGLVFLRSKTRDYDVVLVEECPFDVFAKRHRPFFPWTAKLLKRLVPVPDLLVFCIANPDEIVRRKPELTEAEIEHYYDVMDKVYGSKDRLPIHRHDTNPSQDPYVDLDEIIRKTIG